MYENYSSGILNIGLSSSSKIKVKFMSRNEPNSLLSLNIIVYVIVSKNTFPIVIQIIYYLLFYSLFCFNYLIILSVIEIYRTFLLISASFDRCCPININYVLVRYRSKIKSQNKPSFSLYSSKGNIFKKYAQRSLTQRSTSSWKKMS